jgi:peptidyl-prolyl cis-trans isomerase C
VEHASQALTKLNKGQTVDAPVKTQFGWHIIRLDDVRTPQLPPFDQVKPQLQQQMVQQKLGKYQEELRAKAKIE